MSTYSWGRQPTWRLHVLRELQGRVGILERLPQVLICKCGVVHLQRRGLLGTGESIHWQSEKDMICRTITKWLCDLPVAAQAVVASFGFSVL